MTLVLFGTSGCHLCDDAELLIRNVISTETELQLVDIVDNDRFYEKYQLLIPVLTNNISKRSINWPFDENDIKGIL